MSPQSSRPITIDVVYRDVREHARMISALTDELSDMKKVIHILQMDSAVRSERDKNLSEHLSRIERALEGIRSIGKWTLAVFFGALIAAFVTFLVSGGFSVGPATIPGT